MKEKIKLALYRKGEDMNKLPTQPFFLLPDLATALSKLTEVDLQKFSVIVSKVTYLEE